MNFDTLSELIKESAVQKESVKKESFSWNDALKVSTTGMPIANRGALNHVIDMDSWSRAVLDRQADMNKVGNTLPFPLDRIPSQIADIYMAMVAYRSTLTQALDYGILNTAERELLLQELKRISRMMEVIAQIPSQFDMWSM